MRHKQLFALTAALTLTAGMFFVFFGAAAPEAAPVPPSPPLAEPPSTIRIIFEVIGWEALAEAEDELTEEALSRAANSTTTTIVVTRTKTTSPPSSKSTTTTTSPDSPPTTDVGGYRSDYESDFFGRINSLRSSNGLAALNRNGSLNAYARDWAKRMADSATLDHSEDLASLAPPWSGVAENVGKGGSVSGIFNLLKGSSAHLSNMTGDYTDVGIGVWVDGSGTIWTVHVFTH